MRVSELVPRVKNKRFFLPFLTLGTSTKLLGFMRFSAILDPLEISSRGCTPGKSRDGRTGARAVIGTSTRLRGRGRLLRERNRKGPNKASGAGAWPHGPSRPLAFGKGGGPGKTSGADVRQRPAQARASARRPKARFDSGGTPPRTRGTGSIRRGISRRPKARIDSGGTPPVRGRTGQAALSPSARAGGCTPGMPAICVPQRREGHSKINGADASQRIDQARASARRSKARIGQSGHGPKRQRRHSAKEGM